MVEPQIANDSKKINQIVESVHDEIQASIGNYFNI